MLQQQINEDKFVFAISKYKLCDKLIYLCPKGFHKSETFWEREKATKRIKRSTDKMTFDE